MNALSRQCVNDPDQLLLYEQNDCEMDSQELQHYLLVMSSLPSLPETLIINRFFGLPCTVDIQ